ncbi:MIP/aquaporin family protein [Intrasporangium calvum]|uniref:MIP family channel protein n=1 Tax=Intrasporangium calvum (strain ATCC 23552 / DSM 43043 / JCM 3097 / NBRC 12989 / NCIMB 10167 / NRRL B-3866 / 7 KIP) TaxID=710696 RepID=E6SAA1_INTC7|nr:MIP/aquaporin family protein [Intrasporangium calvum]ADU49349.1 MIP family channel protein [Intrasporangium calvum DSM 43043]AXG14277.1 aquaporin family protein [Intrasporangium calvum]
MRTDMARRLGAELVGTALLVLFGAGSVVATLTVGKGELTYPGLGFISLAFAIVVALVIYVFGPVSGAHINPAVTIALAVTRRFPWVEVVPYVVAQLAGAVIGGLLVVATFGTHAVDLGLGATSLGNGVPYWQGMVAEALGTFLLLLAVMGLAVDARAPLGWAGLMIGLAVALEILLIGPQTGGSVNPARTFGPYLTLSMFGGDVAWSQFGVYVVGPLVGGIVAVLLYDLLAPTRPVQRPAMEDSYSPGDPGSAMSAPPETSVGPAEAG